MCCIVFPQKAPSSNDCLRLWPCGGAGSCATFPCLWRRARTKPCPVFLCPLFLCLRGRGVGLGPVHVCGFEMRVFTAQVNVLHPAADLRNLPRGGWVGDGFPTATRTEVDYLRPVAEQVGLRARPLCSSVQMSLCHSVTVCESQCYSVWVSPVSQCYSELMSLCHSVTVCVRPCVPLLPCVCTILPCSCVPA
jgi:hypothetical protein